MAHPVLNVFLHSKTSQCELFLTQNINFQWFKIILDVEDACYVAIHHKTDI